MAQNTNIVQALTKKPFNYILIALGIGLLLLFSLAFSGGPKIATDKISSVEISGGGRSLTIDKNGVVAITTEEGTVYQTLDSGKLSSLFGYIKKKAESPSKLTADSPGNIITITIVIDGKEVTIYIDADDPEFQDIIDAILNPDTPAGDSISDYFTDDGTGGTSGDDGTTTGSGGSDTPTPTPPGGTDSGGTPVSPNLYLPPGVTDPGGDCTSWNEQVVGKAVISNTVCFKQ